jgi:hypothetical protein
MNDVATDFRNKHARQKRHASAPKPIDIANIEAPMTIKALASKLTGEWKKAISAPPKKIVAPSTKARSEIIRETDFCEKYPTGKKSPKEMPMTLFAAKRIASASRTLSTKNRWTKHRLPSERF